MATSLYTQESPGLEPNWFDEISSFLIKNLKIS